jgi:hypothetical protein
VPESSFEKFVTEALTEVRQNCQHMADALWDLIPRVDKLERVQGVHSRMLRDHAGILRTKPPHSDDSSAPRPMPQLGSIPPLSLGKQTVTGSIIISKADQDEWQRLHDQQEKAKKWDGLLSGTWKVLLAVVAAICIAGVGLLGGALLQQAHTAQPVLTAPHTP